MFFCTSSEKSENRFSWIGARLLNIMVCTNGFGDVFGEESARF
jgi:hypothetical protein